MSMLYTLTCMHLRCARIVTYTGLEESSHLDPTNPYSAAKAGAELVARAYITSYKVSRCSPSMSSSSRLTSPPLLCTAACAPCRTRHALAHSDTVTWVSSLT